MGGSLTASAPFVSDGVIYFRGTNDKLYRQNIDGTGGVWLGNTYTKSTPFVTGNVVYFQGLDDSLQMINLI